MWGGIGYRCLGGRVPEGFGTRLLNPPCLTAPPPPPPHLTVDDAPSAEGAVERSARSRAMQLASVCAAAHCGEGGQDHTAPGPDSAMLVVLKAILAPPAAGGGKEGGGAALVS